MADDQPERRQRILMHKRLLLPVLLLLFCTWLPAQQGEMGQATGKTSGATTIEGCLSNAAGQYFLTDSSGTKHQLSGYANKLKAQVGHEVEITGKPSTKTVSDTAYGAASSAEVIPVFEVKNVKQIADACKSK
jgi:hypothetical protein